MSSQPDTSPATVRGTDDYLLQRAANPRTGLISPSEAGTPPACRTPRTPGEMLALAHSSRLESLAALPAGSAAHGHDYQIAALARRMQMRPKLRRMPPGAWREFDEAPERAPAFRGRGAWAPPRAREAPARYRNGGGVPPFAHPPPVPVHVASRLARRVSGEFEGRVLGEETDGEPVRGASGQFGGAQTRERSISGSNLHVVENRMTGSPEVERMDIERERTLQSGDRVEYTTTTEVIHHTKLPRSMPSQQSTISRKPVGSSIKSVQQDQVKDRSPDTPGPTEIPDTSPPRHAPKASLTSELSSSSCSVGAQETDWNIAMDTETQLETASILKNNPEVAEDLGFQFSVVIYRIVKAAVSKVLEFCSRIGNGPIWNLVDRIISRGAPLEEFRCFLLTVARILFLVYAALCVWQLFLIFFNLLRVIVRPVKVLLEILVWFLND